MKNFQNFELTTPSSYWLFASLSKGLLSTTVPSLVTLKMWSVSVEGSILYVIAPFIPLSTSAAWGIVN